METTCWDLIRDAASGKKREREVFAERYEPVIRSYLAARWRGNDCLDDLDDACQEVFTECFRAGGPLDRVDRAYAGGFRAFMYGVIRNVGLRFEERHQKGPVEYRSDLDELHADETSLSKVFDRAWAVALTQQAADRQTELAEEAGPDAILRVELLRLRFHDELPIREIAHRWEVDAAELHREYAKARQEFKTALREVIAQHRPDSTSGELDQECQNLLLLIGR